MSINKGLFYYKRMTGFPPTHPTRFALEKAVNMLRDELPLPTEPRIEYIRDGSPKSNDFQYKRRVHGMAMNRSKGFGTIFIRMGPLDEMIITLGHEWRHFFQLQEFRIEGYNGDFGDIKTSSVIERIEDDAENYGNKLLSKMINENLETVLRGYIIGKRDFEPINAAYNQKVSKLNELLNNQR